jgi:hypothetical protein
MNDEKKIIIINVAIAIFLGGGIFIGVISMLFLAPSRTSSVVSTPQVVTITNPTATPTSTPQSESVSEEEDDIVTNNDFQVDAVVQIINTDGAGLRLRSNPGISSSVQFIGEEQELFTVINGPVEQDDYIWWYLESPYDETRSGWAAADYLQVIEESD